MTTLGGTHQGQQLIAIATHINQLTRPSRHKATYDVNTALGVQVRNYHTVQPPLLDQLRRTLAPSTADEGTDAYLHKVYESRPPLRPEPLACLLRIGDSAQGWCLALHIPIRATTEDNLSALVGAAGGLDDTQLGCLASDVRSWHMWARMVTNWEVPAWQPYVPCPQCGQRRGLRVRLDQRTALCTACLAYWGPETIEALADHVRRAAAERGDLQPSGECG